MDGKLLLRLYDLNFMVIEKNLKGITHAHSLISPQKDGNCLNWILGHIVATRNATMKLIGEDSILSEEETPPYRRGSVPLKEEGRALALEKLWTGLKGSQEKLSSRLKVMSSAELAARFEGETKYEQLAVLQFHEAYHAGQLGMLRRIVGKPGAIK